MLFKESLNVNITLDYIQTLPMYKRYTQFNGIDNSLAYGVPTELVNAILDSIGVDLNETIETGKHLIRSNVDYTKAKECTVFFCKRKSKLPERYLEKLDLEILLPKELHGEIDILSIGKNNDIVDKEDADDDLIDLLSKQIEDGLY